MATLDSFDLAQAFYTRLIALSVTSMETLRPDQFQDQVSNNTSWRRGSLLGPEPYTAGFGNGVYSRAEGIYQIDLYVPHQRNSAYEVLLGYADDHVTQFWPTNGRGLALTENSTTANIVERPNQRFVGREGSFWRAIVEVPFYVEINPS